MVSDRAHSWRQNPRLVTEPMHEPHTVRSLKWFDVVSHAWYDRCYIRPRPHWTVLQCCDMIYGDTSKRVDIREEWHWITRLAGLQPQQHRESQWHASSTKCPNHELCLRTDGVTQHRESQWHASSAKCPNHELCLHTDDVTQHRESQWHASSANDCPKPGTVQRPPGLQTNHHPKTHLVDNAFSVETYFKWSNG
jgi:hypothetical protein